MIIYARNWLTPVLTLLCLSLTSCSPEQSLTPEDGTSADRFLSGKLSYGFETITWREIVEAGPNENLAFLDQIVGEPTANRQHITVDFLNSSSVKVTTIEEEPIHNKLPSRFDGVPASDIVPVHRTVMENDVLSLYAESGELLFQRDLPEFGDFGLPTKNWPVSMTGQWKPVPRVL